MEITDVEQKREKRLRRNEDSLRELWDSVKCTNIHIIRVTEGEERNDQRKYLIAKNFLTIGRESLTQIQEAQ